MGALWYTSDRNKERENAMTELIRKLCRDRRLTTAEYERLIRERTADSARELRRLADQTRRAVYGNRVLIRGAVELSSICKNDCLYCGRSAGRIGAATAIGSAPGRSSTASRRATAWDTAPSSSGAARTDFTTTRCLSP